ncbi:MAG: hypothetical protein ABIQ81_09365 [Novosphingobium sp.]
MRVSGNRFSNVSVVGGIAAALGAVLVAGCGEKKPVAVNLPPPPMPQVAIPPRPYPPVGAPASMRIPVFGVDGVRETVNARLTPNQTLWNFRSAYNVAALNCLRPEHGEIVVGYRAFLKKQARVLTAANRGVDTEFKGKYGARFIAPREAYMTQVYNYFANPVTLRAFCDASLEMSRAVQVVPPADLQSFSVVELPKIELVFEAFFRAYDQYRMDAANWDAKYAPRPTTVGAPVSSASAPAINAYSPTIGPK